MEKAVDKVKRKLWTFGYSVKDVSGANGLQYDLIVDSKYYIKVVKKAEDQESVPKWITVALVTGKKIRYLVCRSGKCWDESSPLKAFPKVDN